MSPVARYALETLAGVLLGLALLWLTLLPVLGLILIFGSEP